jgi:leucyl-tRNA synthetase
VEKYVHDAALKSDLERTDLNKDKTGVFTGAYAINPLNGERVPIWISDYVLISYGTGAIMAVPAHDSRDWEFAKKFGLPIIDVLKGDVDVQEQVYEGDGPHVNSGFLNGMGVDEAIETVTKWLEERGKGHKAVNYKLRDWIFSRQRYWGEPMPLVHCPHCGTVAVPEDQLPLELPEVKKYEPTGTGESPLANVEEWVNCTCPVCGAPAKRETNTMPQWAGSCWYYLRYLDPHNDKEFASRDKVDYWMPVDLYVGGAEHAVLHLLYARFWHKVLFDLGLVNTDEPFMRLVNQGMITSFAYQRPDKSLVPVDMVDEEGGVFTEKGTGVKLERAIAKMSKSLKNVINPDEIIKTYGADTLRMYEMFMGPLQMAKPWSTQGLQGVHRFLQKVWKICTKPLSDEPLPAELKKLLHKSIKKITDDTGTLNFNTAISQMMVLINEAGKCDVCYREMMDPFTRMLSAYAPHIAEEMWEILGNAPSVSQTKWPVFDPAFAADDTVTIPVQFSGKVREKLDLPAGLDKDALLAAVMENENVKKRLEGKTIVKTIVVPGKLVNLVVK